MPHRAVPLHWRPWALGAALLLGACAQPDRPDQAAAWLGQARFEQAPEPPSQASAQERWWLDVGGEPLDRLVTLGLQRNLDVGVALTRVMEARAGAVAQGSAQWPTLSLEGAVVDQRSTLPAPVKQGRPDTRAWQGSLNLGWELDLFGRNRMAIQAAAQDVLRSEAGVAGARLMLIGDISTQYLRHQGALQRLGTLTQLIDHQGAILRSVEHRAREGDATAIDVASAQARLDELRAQREPLETLRVVTRARLMTLTAATASEVDPWLNTAGGGQAWHSPPTLMPPGQPPELLARRPDLIAARAAWQAEQARLAVARTDLLPRFFISLVTGRQDLKLNGLDLSPARFHESALAFAMPLFNAGRVQAGIDMQDATLQRAGLQYEQAARQALEDVESALADARQSRTQAEHLARALSARQQAAARGDRLLAEGQIGQIDRLGLVQARLAAQLSHTDALERAWLARVRLHQALGGGWQSTPPHHLETRLAAPSMEPQP